MVKKWHTVVVDSALRNGKEHPSSQNYKIDLYPPLKNVTSVKLCRALIPWTLGDGLTIIEGRNRVVVKTPTGSIHEVVIPPGKYANVLDMIAKTGAPQGEIICDNVALASQLGLEDGQALYTPFNPSSGFVRVRVEELEKHEAGVVFVSVSTKDGAVDDGLQNLQPIVFSSPISKLSSLTVYLETIDGVVFPTYGTQHTLVFQIEADP